MRCGRTWLIAAGLVLMLHALALGQEKKMRVLYVGGDWKAQLDAADKPMRGHFIKREVDKVAPGRFDFTLWTSYEFLQYADAQSLGQFDVVVAGDVMGQSVMPRLVEAMSQFVRKGGGLWYCDNHKSFSFLTKERSLEDVLPLEVVPFRAYHESGQPAVAGPVTLKVLEPPQALAGDTIDVEIEIPALSALSLTVR